MLYDSSFDHFVKPKVPGFYIQVENESSDSYVIGPFEVVEDMKHAQKIVERECPGEIEDGFCYANAKFYEEIT
jgi:hypothetical protein